MMTSLTAVKKLTVLCWVKQYSFSQLSTATNQKLALWCDQGWENHQLTNPRKKRRVVVQCGVTLNRKTTHLLLKVSQVDAQGVSNNHGAKRIVPNR